MIDTKIVREELTLIARLLEKVVGTRVEVKAKKEYYSSELGISIRNYNDRKIKVRIY